MFSRVAVVITLTAIVMSALAWALHKTNPLPLLSRHTLGIGAQTAVAPDSLRASPKSGSSFDVSSVPEGGEFATRPGTNKVPLEELPTRQEPKTRSLSDDPETNSDDRSSSGSITGADEQVQSPGQSSAAGPQDPLKPKLSTDKSESSARRDEMISSSAPAHRSNPKLQVGHSQRHGKSLEKSSNSRGITAPKAKNGQSSQGGPLGRKVIDVYAGGSHIIILCNRLSRQQALESGC